MCRLLTALLLAGFLALGLVLSLTPPDGDNPPMSTRPYGWRPSPQEARDAARQFLLAPRLRAALPASVDLRPHMPPVVDQGRLGSCFDAETEVLTDHGWKPWADLDGTERLASVSPDDGALIFEHPNRLVRFHYVGPMYYGRHQALDFAVTPDHKMLVRPWDEAKRTLDDTYRLVPMEDVGWYVGLMNSVRYAGDNPSDTYTLPGVSHKRKRYHDDLVLPMKAWLRFLGIYLAEGTVLQEVRYKKVVMADGSVIKERAGQNHKVQIAASKPREKAFIRETLDGVGVNYLELPDRFTFQDKRVYAELGRLGLRGVKAPEKFVPSFVFRQRAEDIKEFLFAHAQGDGCEQEGRLSHYTSSVRLASDLQTLSFLAGEWASVGNRPPRKSVMKDGRVVLGKYPEYRVGRWTSRNLSVDRKEDIHIEPYDGEVFCAEVPTYHTLVTRRHGKLLISGNCTANAMAGLLGYDLAVQGQKVYPVSRLFGYYNERAIEGTVAEDAGATISDTIQAARLYGFVDEALWPYDVSQYAVKPPQSVYDAAVPERLTDYAAVGQDQDSYRGALAQGHPVIFGFTVYASFEAAWDTPGVMPLPAPGEQVLGGHAVLAVGYDDARQAVLCRNSWGTGWGLQGYFWMPYAFLFGGKDASDAWVVSSVPGGIVPPTPTPKPPDPPGPTPVQALFTFQLNRDRHKGDFLAFALPLDLGKGKYGVVPGMNLEAPFCLDA